MELWVALWVLYALQCVCWLPGGAVLFVRPARAWWASSGPGWRLQHPVPGASLRASRFPLTEERGVLYGAGGTSWLGSRLASRPAPSPDSLGETSARGDTLLAGGEPLARAASPRHAAALAELLRRLSDRPESTRPLLEGWLRDHLSLDRFREERSRFEAATRWLAWSGGVYAVALLVLLPGVLLFVGEERGLFLALPALAALHLGSLVALALAARRLTGEGTAQLVERLLTAALYPPLLLRARDQLAGEILGVQHPAVAAAALLAEPRRRAFLRAELLRAARAAEAAPDAPGLGLAELELCALRRLAREVGEPAEVLLTPPHRQDPLARAYCPACHCEYRRDGGACSDCGFALAAYAERAPGMGG